MIPARDPVTRTTCAYCGVGCGVLASRLTDGETEAFSVRGDPSHPASAGRLCTKGSALADTIGSGSSSGRLLHPSIDGQQATWDEALDKVAARFSETVAIHGPGSVAFYVSGQLLTEDYYVANKLMKGFIGSANIDTNSRLCMSSAVVAHQRAFGEDVVPGCYEDFELADLLVLVGSNTAWCHPVLWRRVEEERLRRPEMRVVVIDPRRTPTCEGADLHLALRSGSDVVLFDGLLAWLDREGFADREYVAAHTSGADEAVDVARRYAGTIEAVAEACGLNAARVEEFYLLFATTERVVTAFSQGVNQSSSGSDKATSILNCHLLTGRIGKPGAGPFSLTGQPNAMGGREVGGMASMLAAHLRIEDDAHREIVRRFWGNPHIATKPGLKAVDLFEAVHQGRIKALWIMATNPAASMPDADRVKEAIANCDFVVVSDCVARTDTTTLAHVLLPAAAWGEKDGTTTNSERCIARQRAFASPAGEARPDWWIVSQVAARMGYSKAFAYTSAHEIFDEHARLSAAGNGGTRMFDIGGLAGLSADEYDALEPIRWPVPTRGHQGTTRIFGDARFEHADGRARLVPTPPRAPTHSTSEQFPLVLNSGRIRDQWHTMTRTGMSARLAEHTPEPFVDVHTDDAAAAGLTDDDLVQVTTRWGTTMLRASISGGVARGALFVPIHWSASNSSSGRIGALVNPSVDPLSGEPEFKHTPASIARVPATWHGVVFSRDPIDPPAGAWWVHVRGEDAARIELAGVDSEPSWPAWCRRAFAVEGEGDALLEYVDDGAGIYRAARVVAGRLESCMFVSRRRAALPAREWIAELFTRASLGDNDRTALLAGRSVEAGPDAGPLVCSCFAVRRMTIARAIERDGLETAAQVGICLKAGTNCGSCLPEIRAMLTPVSTCAAA